MFKNKNPGVTPESFRGFHQHAPDRSSLIQGTLVHDGDGCSQQATVVSGLRGCNAEYEEALRLQAVFRLRWADSLFNRLHVSFVSTTASATKPHSYTTHRVLITVNLGDMRTTLFYPSYSIRTYSIPFSVAMKVQYSLPNGVSREYKTCHVRVHRVRSRVTRDDRGLPKRVPRRVLSHSERQPSNRIIWKTRSEAS